MNASGIAETPLPPKQGDIKGQRTRIKEAAQNAEDTVNTEAKVGARRSVPNASAAALRYAMPLSLFLFRRFLYHSRESRNPRFSTFLQACPGEKSRICIWAPHRYVVIMRRSVIPSVAQNAPFSVDFHKPFC